MLSSNVADDYPGAYIEYRIVVKPEALDANKSMVNTNGKKKKGGPASSASNTNTERQIFILTNKVENLEKKNSDMLRELNEMREQNMILSQQSGVGASLESHGYF